MTDTRRPRTRQLSNDDHGLGEEQPLDRETTPAGQAHDQYGKQVLRAVPELDDAARERLRALGHVE